MNAKIVDSSPFKGEDGRGWGSMVASKFNNLPHPHPNPPNRKRRCRDLPLEGEGINWKPLCNFSPCLSLG